MPSALTMLMCYEDQLERAREQGLPAMRERARLALRIRALSELVLAASALELLDG